MTFKPLTDYVKAHALPYKEFVDGSKLYRAYPHYYYITKDEKSYARVSEWIAKTINNEETVTYVIGPFVFINGFEESKEGKYLCKMFPYYFNMTPAVKRKVEIIFKTYGWWVRLHKQYIEASKRR